MKATKTRSFSARGWNTVRVTLGVLLLGAAIFKAHAFWTDTAQPLPLFSSSRIQVAVIEVEGLLGIWLVSGTYHRAARFSALVFFGFLASVSLYMGVSGESSCGCLGRVKLNPWIMFVVDLGAVTALALSHVPTRATATSLHSLSVALRLIAGSVVIVSLAFAGLFLFSNDPWRVVAGLRNEMITVEPGVIHVGSGSPGEERELVVTVVNHSDHTVRFIGGTASCSCMVTDDLPLALSPRESRAIHVRLRFRGGSGAFQHRFVFYTDDEGNAVVLARFAGRVTPALD
jgi:methylamine utilization protein MauE